MLRWIANSRVEGTNCPGCNSRRTIRFRNPSYNCKYIGLGDLLSISSNGDIPRRSVLLIREVVISKSLQWILSETSFYTTIAGVDGAGVLFSRKFDGLNWSGLPTGCGSGFGGIVAGKLALRAAGRRCRRGGAQTSRAQRQAANIIGDAPSRPVLQGNYAADVPSNEGRLETGRPQETSDTAQCFMQSFAPKCRPQYYRGPRCWLNGE